MAAISKDFSWHVTFLDALKPTELRVCDIAHSGMLRPSMLLGVLRASARPTSNHSSKNLFILSVRQLSINILQARPRKEIFGSSLYLSIPCHHRLLSLGSIFARPRAIPSPLTVANITRLEAEANVQPHDVSKQVALFEALIETKLRPSYELVVSRWEKMCEFDPSSPLLHSSTAFKLYLTCLLNLGQKTALTAAVRRRDALVMAHPAAILSGQKIPIDASNVVPSEQPVTANSQVTIPSSQEIAQAVLIGQTEPTAPSGSRGSLWSRLNGSEKDAEGNAGPIQVTIVERKGAWAPGLIRYAISAAVILFLVLVVMSVIFENNGYVKTATRQPQFEYTDKKPIRFSDVHGVDEAKDELQDVVMFLKDPTAFASLGGKLPKGVLLTGPPGTGKTLLARAIAGEAGVPFFSASGSDFDEMFVGVGAKRIRDLFEAARKKQPAIIFIDELDAVGGKRNRRDQNHARQTLNQLLVEMDGFQQSEGVIVIAATNFPQSLDQALTRPGRFDRHVAVPLPDIRGRAQILQHYMRNITVSKDVEPKMIARGTSGFSGAQLQNMVNQAAIQAAKERATQVTLKHFDWARDRIIMGAERKSQFIDPEVKLSTAYHEGGHALVALYTDGAMPLHKVTCVPRGHALGYTSQLPENDRVSISYKQYIAGIDVSMGGRVAEELIYGKENVTSGASSDIKSASRTARAMVKEWGFSALGPIAYDNESSEVLSPRRKEEIEDEVTKLIRDAENRVIKLLTDKIDELHRLALALVEHETLDSDEVRKVIKGEPISNISEVLDADLSSMEES